MCEEGGSFLLPERHAGQVTRTSRYLGPWVGRSCLAPTLHCNYLTPMITLLPPRLLFTLRSLPPNRPVVARPYPPKGVAAKPPVPATPPGHLVRVQQFYGPSLYSFATRRRL